METLIHRHQNEYYDALLEAGKLGESTVFVEFMLGIIRDALLDVKSQQSEAVAIDGQAIASDRESQVIAYARANDRVYVADVAKYLGVSKQRARAIVRGLVDNGVLRKHGNGRYTYYTL